MGMGRFRRRTWDRLTRRWCYPSLLRWVLGYGYPAYGCGYGYPSYAYGSSYGYGYRRLIMAAYYPRYRYAGTPIVGLIMDTAAIRIVDPNGLSRVRSKRH